MKKKYKDPLFIFGRTEGPHKWETPVVVENYWISREAKKRVETCYRSYDAGAGMYN